MKSIEWNGSGNDRAVEALERRLMLDGDVTASLRGGDLTIRGDAEDNAILITQPTRGTIHIEGLDDTAVNGEESVEFSLGAGDLTIIMGKPGGKRAPAGEDQVSIQGRLLLRGDLDVQLNMGEVAIEGSAGAVQIRGDVDVRTGKHGHVAIRNAVRIDGELSVKAGGDVSIASAQAMLPDFDAASFSDSLAIDNPYMPLVPGTTYTYQSEEIDEDTGELTVEDVIVEVLPDTRTILGVEARVVRDRVFVEGLLIEDTHDWFAQDDDGNVWYLGEDVINYEYDDEGNLIGTDDEGAWEAGVDGALPGVVMLARPQVGLKYYQEFTPGDALDDGEVLAIGETMTVPAGTFTDLLRTKDTTALEPFELENKLYAPGLGMIAEFHLDIEDDEVEATTRLISVELNGVPVTQVVPTSQFFRGTNPTGRTIGGIEIDEEATISAKGPVILLGAELEDELSAGSRDALVVADSVLENDARLSTRDTVSLRDVFADGTIRVEGDPDDVYILNSDLHAFKAHFGPNDNTLAVGDSSVDYLFADGGPGENIFDDLDGNDFGRLRLSRFTRS